MFDAIKAIARFVSYRWSFFISTDCHVAASVYHHFTLGYASRKNICFL